MSKAFFYTFMRLRERLLSFVRHDHPEYWPQERIAGSDETAAATIAR